MEQPHKVNTDISYAPTKSFATAFPNEIPAQAAKFTRPSWQRNVPQPEVMESAQNHFTAPAQLPRDKEERELLIIGGAVFLATLVVFGAFWFFSKQ